MAYIAHYTPALRLTTQVFSKKVFDRVNMVIRATENFALLALRHWDAPSLRARKRKDGVEEFIGGTALGDQFIHHLQGPRRHIEGIAGKKNDGQPGMTRTDMLSEFGAVHLRHLKVYDCEVKMGVCKLL